MRRTSLIRMATLAVPFIIGLVVGSLGLTSSSAQPAGRGGSGEKSMADQMKELQEKMAELEKAMKQNHANGGGNTGKQGGGGMGGMGGGSGGGMGDMDGEMGGMGGGGGGGGMMDDMDEMGGMGGGGSGGMMDDMMDMKMGSDMMGKTKGMRSMQKQSALPGFPGASHIYHVGSTGFFLDHPEHITLTADQEMALRKIKEKTQLEHSNMQRDIDQAEQELWVLTGSDTPDAAKIDEKVRAIEKLRGDQRVHFIRAVGEAANLLTEYQRKVLSGLQKPDAGGTDPAQPKSDMPDMPGHKK